MKKYTPFVTAVRSPGVFQLFSSQPFKNMTSKKFFILTLALFILAGCTKDAIITTDKALADDNPALTTAQAYVDQATAELEADFNNGPAIFETFGFRGLTYVPAGNSDALRQAFAQASPGDQIILMAGLHKLSSTLVIDKTLDIVGEDGTVLEFDLPVITDETYPPVAAIHVKNVQGLRIQGVLIKSKEGQIVYGILATNSSHVWIADNVMTGFRNAVYMVNSDEMRVYGNELTGADRKGVGIGLTNGYNTKLRGNTVSGFAAGVFPTGNRGIAYGNEFFDNNVGYILSQNSGAPLPDGTFSQAEAPSTQWTARRNNSHDNDWGYLIIDGAFKNFMFENFAADNDHYDIELAGESFRFGGPDPVPTSKDNIVKSYGPDFNQVSIKDCGQNNLVIGGQMVDHATDACF